MPLAKLASRNSRRVIPEELVSNRPATPARRLGDF
jgi:hypothetical protein